jgi:serine/threonine-protein kinase
LKDYYENEGLNDPVSIAFYSGSYVPRFSYIVRESGPIILGERVVGSRLNPLTIAVLPFENLSSDEDQDFFCDGVSEDIIYALSRIPGLKVIGRTSVFALKGIAYDVRDTGIRLGAGTIVDGSVRRSGSMVRIFAELINAETRQVRWADTFNRTMEDVFAVQSEIAQTVARVLQMELAPPVSGRLIRSAPSLDAYLLYLKGRYAWNRLSTPGFGTAVDIFEQAIAKHPTYASPYAGLADVYASMVLWGEVRPRDICTKALNAADHAMKLDPLLPHAYASGAIATGLYERRWDEALQLAHRSTELEPSYSFGHFAYGICLAARGRIKEAHNYFEESLALDPLSVRTNRAVGWSYYFQREFSNAEKWMQAALEMHAEPLQTRYLLGQVFAAQRRFEAALEQAQQCQTNPPDPLTLGLLGACQAHLGYFQEAREVLAKLSILTKSDYVDPLAVGRVHIALGNMGHALESVEEMLEERTSVSAFIELDPVFDPLRGEPRFKELVAKHRGERAQST